MKGLSICIPTYNFNCMAAVKTLSKQLQSLQLDAEIIVIDDASNTKLSELANFKNAFYSYTKLEQNIGRSKIRNLLVEKSKFDYILFIDADSEIPKNYIETYLLSIKKYPNALIYGGTKQPENLISKNRLRHNYGVKYEYKKALIRNKKPYNNFRTNNFISAKHILKSTPFNEEIVKYGHEDTFLAYELNKKNIEIIHIENPVIHLDDDSNSGFISKTKHSIENLILLKSKYPDFAQHSKLSFINNFIILSFKPIKSISTLFYRLFECISKYSNSADSFQLFKLFYTIAVNKHEHVK